MQYNHLNKANFIIHDNVLKLKTKTNRTSRYSQLLEKCDAMTIQNQTTKH
jgi:hypothetical protein